MNDHYYTRVPQSESRPVDCEFTYRGIPLTFRTDAGVFSRGEVDTGTRLLLEALPEEMGGDVLDLGCGWGVIGISVARKWPETRVTMADVNTRALELSRENAKRNRAEVTCVESDGMAALAGRTSKPSIRITARNNDSARFIMFSSFLSNHSVIGGHVSVLPYHIPRGFSVELCPLFP